MDAAGGCLESHPAVNSKERDTARAVVYRKHLLQSLTLSHLKVAPLRSRNQSVGCNPLCAGHVPPHSGQSKPCSRKLLTKYALDRKSPQRSNSLSYPASRYEFKGTKGKSDKNTALVGQIPQRHKHRPRKRMVSSDIFSGCLLPGETDSIARPACQ